MTTTTSGISRRTLLASAGAAALGAAVKSGPFGATATAATRRAADWDRRALTNPLVLQRADAQIRRDENGLYYMTGSVPEYDRLVVRASRTLAGLTDAPETVIWRRPTSGPLGGYIWAPEIHHIDGRWYCYFAAGDSDDPFHIRTYIIASSGNDPREPLWGPPVMLVTAWDTFTLDSTNFVHRGIRYLVWAQHEPGIDTNSNIYIAPLASPTQLGGPPVRIAVPTLPWEIQGFKVNEGPAVIIRNGRVFMTFSASATDARYSMGLLTADADADLLDPASWVKSPQPIFTTSEVTSVYGPGHNSFTVDEHGRDILVYHGRDYRDIVGDPLFDPNRHTRVQRLYWNDDGTPAFGIPVGNGPLPVRLAPLDAPDSYITREDAQVTLADPLHIETSQFRLRDGLAGKGTTSFEALDAPGRFLRATAGGASLAANDGSSAFAAQASFIRRPGLAGRRGTSWEAVATRHAYLSHDGDTVRLATIDGHGARASATFLLL
jgi:GH43 family beta-xylosidase